MGPRTAAALSEEPRKRGAQRLLGPSPPDYTHILRDPVHLVQSSPDLAETCLEGL